MKITLELNLNYMRKYQNYVKFWMILEFINAPSVSAQQQTIHKTL